MTTELLAFLDARITDDERSIGDAQTVSSALPRHVVGTMGGTTVLMSAWRFHAETEAKRRILSAHPIEPYDDDPTIGFCQECQRGGAAGIAPCTTLRLLALPYADHPDYRPEWRPHVTGWT
ncbi:hypothetical protein AMK27_30765 [Streptomyces sp. CB02009]|uniref:DUF6221 family protein n=1 Tax=Streptomyces sp. CB02009 TaxID=1703938 RepID=UPI00093C8F0F|nr:DUF6221 family protein [Streptomyces sp. CB02009]OKJ52223.1 hypothetical protein AMK27_30765 [Streptomyces sp. CB02009]